MLVTLPLRLMLAAAQIADWTTSWKTVALVTLPFVGPFELIGPLNEHVVRYVTLAEVLATLVFVLLAVYFLARLTVRRRL